MVITPPTKPGQVPDLKQSDVRETTSQSTLLANKTSFFAVPANSFIPQNPDTDTVSFGDAWTGDGGEQSLIADGDGIRFSAGVNLPHDAVVTSVIVQGNAAAAAESWSLGRWPKNDSALNTAMASANINTADTTISNAKIDNETYNYQIGTSTLDTNDIIYGATIIYTTNYI